MKNITVSVDEETHRAARIRAAELGTAVSALVRNYLRSLSRDRFPAQLVKPFMADGSSLNVSTLAVALDKS